MGIVQRGPSWVPGLGPVGLGLLLLAGCTASQQPGTPASGPPTTVAGQLGCTLVPIPANWDQAGVTGADPQVAVAKLVEETSDVAWAVRWAGAPQSGIWLLHSADGQGFGTARVTRREDHPETWVAGIDEFCAQALPEPWYRDRSGPADRPGPWSRGLPAAAAARGE